VDYLHRLLVYISALLLRGDFQPAFEHWLSAQYQLSVEQKTSLLFLFMEFVY